MSTLTEKLIASGCVENEQDALEAIRETRAAFHKLEMTGKDVADLHDFQEARWGFDPDSDETEDGK